MSNMNKCKGMVSFLNCKFFYKKKRTSYQKDLFLSFLLSKLLKKDKRGVAIACQAPFFIKEMKKCVSESAASAAEAAASTEATASAASATTASTEATAVAHWHGVHEAT